jgi:hypothetical protein
MCKRLSSYVHCTGKVGTLPAHSTACKKQDATPLSAFASRVRRAFHAVLRRQPLRSHRARPIAGRAAAARRSPASQCHAGAARQQPQQRHDKFFKRVTADHYVIVPHNMFRLPDEETLEMIVNARGDAQYSIQLPALKPMIWLDPTKWSARLVQRVVPTTLTRLRSNFLNDQT